MRASCSILAGATGAPIHQGVAFLSGETFWTVTNEVALSALARSTILARVVITKIHPGLTVSSGEALYAATLITVDQVNTSPTIHARACRAIVVIGLTEPSGKATLAGAGEGVDIVSTSGSILAWIRKTFVNVLLAILPSEARHADTLVVPSFVKTAPSIKTGRSYTVISIDQTIASFKSSSALTGVTTIVVHACGTISAGHRCRALVDIKLTPRTLEAQATRAGEFLVVPVWRASPTTFTGFRRTRVHLTFASLPGVRRFADAFKIIDFINACPLVPTWMVGTIINVHLTVLA